MPKEQSPRKPTTRRYSPEEKAAAVRMVRALRAALGTDHGTVYRVPRQLGCGVESVRCWVRQADIDDGHSPGLSTAESQRVKISSSSSENSSGPTNPETSGQFLRGRARPPTQEVVAFINANRDEFGVEPICTALRSAGVQVAPST